VTADTGDHPPGDGSSGGPVEGAPATHAGADGVASERPEPPTAAASVNAKSSAASSEGDDGAADDSIGGGGRAAASDLLEAEATTTPPAPGHPTGPAYALARWIELTDDRSPWWAKSDGIGLRLQLREIQELSAALQGGEVVGAAVKRLLKDTRRMFGESSYCATAHPPVADRVTAALRDKDAAELLPGGAAIAAVTAAAVHLDEIDVIERLINDIAEVATVATDLDNFLELDERIVLLDAELAYGGYSREWRSRAAEAATNAYSAGDSVGDAVRHGLDSAGRRDPSTFEAIVPIREHKTPHDLVLRASFLEQDKAEERISGWPGGASLLGALDDIEVALQLRGIRASDPDAAAEIARDRLARTTSVWALQDGLLEPADSLLVHDEAGKRSYERPVARRLIARPDHLATYGEALTVDPENPAIRRITDALDQLAQARTGSQGAALADLWSVAETLFGGVAEDKPVDVGDRLAGLAEYLYVENFLTSLGFALDASGLDPAGLTRDAGESHAEFAVRCIDRPRKDVNSLLDAIVGADRPLEWVRIKQILRWDDRRTTPPKDRCYLATDLGAVHARVGAVANRAYLVRNLFLHQGNPGRAAAMAVTLPIFADVLHAAISYVNRVSGEKRLPLVTSELAQLRAQQVAAAYTRTGNGPDPLPQLINLSDA
jgi:hypothetical protein